MMKLAPEPKYKKLYSELVKDYESLKLENETLKDKVLLLSSMVLSGKIGSVAVQDGVAMVEVPERVAKWMVEYGMPWQVFKCEQHGLWITELDSCFPYHMEQCKCDKC